MAAMATHAMGRPTVGGSWFGWRMDAHLGVRSRAIIATRLTGRFQMTVESSPRHANAGKPRASILDARANRVHLAFSLSPVRRRDKAARPDAGTARARYCLVDRVGPPAILVIGHGIPLPHHPGVQIAATGMARPDHPPVAIGRSFLAGHRGYADQSLEGPGRFDAAGPDPEPTPAGLATFGRVDAVQAHPFAIHVERISVDDACPAARTCVTG